MAQRDAIVIRQFVTHKQSTGKVAGIERLRIRPTRFIVDDVLQAQIHCQTARQFDIFSAGG